MCVDTKVDNFKTVEFKGNSRGRHGYEEFCTLANEIGWRFEGVYLGVKEKLPYTCNKGHKGSISSTNFRKGKRCPKCAGNCPEQAKEEFYKLLEKEWYRLVGVYKTTQEKVECICKNGHLIFVTPLDFKHGKRCGICANKNVLAGFNDIATTDKHLIKLFADKNDATKYTRSSDHKVEVCCPDCFESKIMVIKKLTKAKRVTCCCSKTSVSYGEKFVKCLLEQSNLEFEREKKFTWAKDKRYDFYIESLNCVVEVHGFQHYHEWTRGEDTLEKIQHNDLFKKELALNNGIKYYIELDVKESEYFYIVDSIQNNKDLNELIDLTKINLKLCEEYAIKNTVKEICEYYNENNKKYSLTEIASHKEITNATLVTYLKKGNEFGWCNYDTENKGFLKDCKKTIVTKDGILVGEFKSLNESIRYFGELGIKIQQSNAMKVANGGRKHTKGYVFKYID